MNNYTELPILEEVEEIWSYNWHDGQIIGIASYKGEICWFELIDFDEKIYILFALNKDQKDECIFYKDTFEKVYYHVLGNIEKLAKYKGPKFHQEQKPIGRFSFYE